MLLRNLPHKNIVADFDPQSQRLLGYHVHCGNAAHMSAIPPPTPSGTLISAPEKASTRDIPISCATKTATCLMMRDEAFSGSHGKKLTSSVPQNASAQ